MPRRHARLLRTAALAAAVLVAPFALAQTNGALERVAPPTALLALGFAPDGGAPQGLVDPLGALDWEGAGATLARLGELLGEDAFGAAADGGMNADALRAGLAETCPAAADALTDVEPMDLLVEGLLTVSIAPFAPMPQALAVARTSDVAVAGALQDALVGCFGGPSFDQDGVPLHVLGDGGDLPLIVARVGDLFLAGTDPDLVRGAIRRANGADEPSLADGPLGAARAQLAPGGIDLAFDAAALADVLEGLSGSLPPEANPIVLRTTGALRTLGAGASRVAWDDRGLRFEQVLVVPDDAPDAALARLLTSAPRAGRPLWLPAEASAVASNHVPLRAWIDYVDGWLVDLEPLTGVRADVRGLAREHLDLDLDAALLGWVGETVHSVTLEPLSTDLRTWVYGPGTVVMVPVADEAAARDGIRLLGPGLLSAFARLAQLDSGGSMDPFGADPFAPEPMELDGLFGTGSVAVDTITIDGIEADRIRMGPTLDLAVAVVDGHLVLATPPSALAALLEARGGRSDLLSGTTGAPWRAAYAEVPDGARDVSIGDVPATLRGLAALAELASQPLASGIQTALLVAPWESMTSFDDDWGGSFDDGDYDPFGDPWLLDENGRTPAADWNVEALVGTALADRGAIELGTTVDDELTEAEPFLAWDLVAAPGTLVQAEVTDPAGSGLDTYLYVADADTGLVLFENDDFGGLDRSVVVFEAVEGIRYRIVASSYGGYGFGAIVVSVQDRAAVLAQAAAPQPEAVEPMEPEVPAEVEPDVEPPTFAELLSLTDLMPRALAILAERSGFAVGATTVEGNVVRTITTIPLR